MSIQKPRISPGPWEANGSGAVDIKLDSTWIEGAWTDHPEAIANAKAIACLPQMMDVIIEMLEIGETFSLRDKAKAVLIEAGCEGELLENQ